MIRDSILLMWRGYFIDVINMSVSNRHILLMLLTLFLRVFFFKIMFDCIDKIKIAILVVC